MYSPTTRLLTVLALLQSYSELSGSEIARRLEVNIRSVRRYIVMLQDMGIPIEGERGRYGAYRLQRGYKLPPLMFSDAEAVALTLGLLTIREFQFPVYVAAVEGALAKTERVLPETLLHQVRGLREAITFNVSPAPVLTDSNVVALLSSAVKQQKQVQLSYRSFNGVETERDFDPYGLVYNEGYWYVSGYCHLRHDLRTFRLDRVIALELLVTTFERPANFDVLGHVLASIAMMPGTRQVEILMETTIERAKEVIPPVLGSLEPSEKGVILRRSATQLDWIARFLIWLDFPVHVIKSAELRDLLRQMAAKALQIAGDEH